MEKPAPNCPQLNVEHKVVRDPSKLCNRKPSNAEKQYPELIKKCPPQLKVKAKGAD